MSGPPGDPDSPLQTAPQRREHPGDFQTDGVAHGVVGDPFVPGIIVARNQDELRGPARDEGHRQAHLGYPVVHPGAQGGPQGLRAHALQQLDSVLPADAQHRQRRQPIHGVQSGRAPDGPHRFLVDHVLVRRPDVDQAEGAEGFELLDVVLVEVPADHDLAAELGVLALFLQPAQRRSLAREVMDQRAGDPVRAMGAGRSGLGGDDGAPSPARVNSLRIGSLK